MMASGILILQITLTYSPFGYKALYFSSNTMELESALSLKVSRLTMKEKKTACRIVHAVTSSIENTPAELE